MNDFLELLNSELDPEKRAELVGGQIGKKIAELRRGKRYTQSEFGMLIGVSGQAVSKWEHGGMPDVSLIPSIADAFGITTDELFGVQKDPDAVAKRDMLTLSEEEFLGYVHDYFQKRYFPDPNELPPLSSRAEGDYDDDRFFDMLFKIVRAMHDGSFFENDAYNESWDSRELDERSKKIPLSRLLITDAGNMLVTGEGSFPLLVAVRDADDLRETLLDDELLQPFFADLADPEFFHLAVYVQTHGSIYSEYTADYLAKTLELSPKKTERMCERLVEYGFVTKKETTFNNETRFSYRVERNIYFRPILMLVYMMTAHCKRQYNLHQNRLRPML